MSWIDEVLIQHQEFESPKNFWYWSALAAMSAVLKDNVYLDKFAYKMYPNIYVMLHADSGMRKGPPIAMANELVAAVNNTNMVTGRFSIQGLLKKLGTSQSIPGGKIKNISSAFICSSELTSSIVEDKAATLILTALYDRNYNTGEYESLLKMETFKLNKPVVSMLGATNEAHFNNFFTGSDVHGGYIARTFVIYEKVRQAVNSLMFAPERPTDHAKLAEYLKQLATLKGAVHIDNNTRIYFDKWYKSFVKQIDESEYKDATGTMNRFDDSVLKIALLLSLSADPTKLEITYDAIEEAIARCEQLVGNIRRVTISGNSTHQYVQHKIVLIKELLSRDNHMITREQFNKKYWQLGNSSDWDLVATSMQDAGHIRLESAGAHIMYVMDESKVDDWMKFFEGK